MNHTDRNYSNLSEFENLSDSDWLDVASSRASEDDDSLAGFEDSDRDDADGRSQSRHSFTSYSSSRDEVVAWEGLIDENSDLETPLPLADHNELDSSVDTDIVRPSSPQTDDEDPEDERVKAALDQSMMSTLSSSRSNSLANSIQTSTGNSTRLRLSFPDPTTSRLESLSTSFEDLSHSETNEHTKDGAATYADAVSAEPASDPGLYPTPVVQAADARDQDPVIAASRVKPDLRVVLYGASPLVKDSLVQMLLDKLALGTGLVRAQTVKEAPRVVSHIFNAQESKTWKSPLRSICVVDKTGLQQSLSLESDCPSLAVVFLPSYSEISLFDHTLYLPVMTSSPLSIVDFLKTTDYLLEAEQQWEDLGIPFERLTCFSQLSSPVVDQEALESSSPAQVYQALKPLIPASTKKTTVQVSAYAVAIMTVLSIVLGYVVNGCMDSQSSVHKVVSVRPPSLPWWATSHVPTIDSNKSTAPSLLAITSPITAVSVSSLKDLAVAVFNPTSPSLSSTASGSQSVASASTPTASASQAAPVVPSECDCGCGLLTWPGKTDVMVRPTASSSLSTYGNTPKSISVITTTQSPRDRTADNTDKGKGKAAPTSEAPWAPGLRLIEAYFADARKGADIQEIVDAIDRLMQVIAQQTASFWKQSRGTVALLKGGLHERNLHAKARARQIRETGVQWLTAVGEHLKVHAEAANRNAKAIRERLSGVDVVDEIRSRKAAKKQRRQEKKEMRKEMKHAAAEEKKYTRLEKKLESQEKKQAWRMQRFMRAIERAG